MTAFEKLYKSETYKSLSKDARVLYLYLKLHTYGSVLNARAYGEEMLLDLAFDRPTLGKAIKELKSGDVLIVHPKDGYTAYFVLIDSYLKEYKAEAVIKKLKQELKELPKDLAEKLSSRFKMQVVSRKLSKREFVEPTQEEIMEFALSKGFLIDAKQVIEYYRECAKQYDAQRWVDGRGNPVISWKNKLTTVWFKNANKLPEHKNAPEGFQFFYVKVDGDIISPDYWENGKPYSKNMPNDIALKREYARQTSS